MAQALLVYSERYFGFGNNTTPRPSNVTGGLLLILNFYQTVYLCFLRIFNALKIHRLGKRPLPCSYHSNKL